MTASAIIIAEGSEQRRTIAQRLSPLKFFEQIYYCGSLKQLGWLLDRHQISLIFCEAGPSEDQNLWFTASLANLAKKHLCPLVFFSASSPAQLFELGLLPSGSHCCSFQEPDSDLDKFLRSLLSDPSPTTRKVAAEPSAPTHVRPYSGFYNRFAFDSFVSQEQARSQLTGRPFSMLLINPQLSPAEETSSDPDPYLSNLVLRINHLVRSSDRLCHIEGQKLALILPETPSQKAQQVLERIQKEVLNLSRQFPLVTQVNLSLLHQPSEPVTNPPLPEA